MLQRSPWKMQTQIREIVEPLRYVDNFILDWHQFPLDYWWRKKHNVPFGSQQHRDMNFFDMLVEYREEFVMNKLIEKYKKDEEQKQNEKIGLQENEDVVNMSKEQIDDDYENLDLSQFD